ncbi:MAG: MerR family transcriptional regulator [Thermoleophilia bacterium]
MTTSELARLAESPACSLDAGAAATRAAEFRALLAPRVRRLQRDGSVGTIDLEMGVRAERDLRDLLAAELECCPFWRFRLDRTSPRRVRLEVRAVSPFEDALDAFLSLAGSRDLQERTYRAGEAARQAGVGVETLRYYERRGLMPTPQRRPSGHREYTTEDIRLLVAIKAAQRLGFTLAETREIVRVTRFAQPGEPATLQTQVEAKLQEVEERIRGLELMRAELRAVLAAECDTLIDCDCGDCPIDGHPAPPARRLHQVSR